MIFTLTDAAHKYGLDNNASNSITNMSIVGKELSTEFADTSFGDSGKSVTHFSNGFDANTVYSNASSFLVVITEMSLNRVSPLETIWRVTGTIIATTALSTTAASIYAGADTFSGNNFDNVLQSYKGNDYMDGKAGTDTAVLSGTRSQYSILNGASLLTFGPDGSDTMVNVERLMFDDVCLAFDTQGAAGQAYRLYQAAFNRTPDKAGFGYQMQALDKGATLKQVAQNFLNSPEFRITYGANLDDSNFVTQLYQNVLHRPPDTGGLDFQIKALASGTDRAQLLVNFSESPENQAALIGVIQDGMAYTA